MDLVFFVVGYAALGLIAMSVLFVVAGSLWLHRKLSHVEADLDLVGETGRDLHTGFEVPALRWMPLVRLGWTWTRRHVYVESRLRRGVRREWVKFSHRGFYHSLERLFTLEGMFGLSRIMLAKRSEDQKVLILPHLGQFAQMRELHSPGGGGDWPHPRGMLEGDRVDLRRYYPGDPARFIHWKVYSRTQTLMLRSPEAALSRSRKVVCYLVAGEGDEPTAALARYVLEKRLYGSDWLFGADGAPQPTRSLEEALRSLAASQPVQDPPGTDLGRFLEQVRGEGPITLNVFVPPLPGPWVSEVVRIARSSALVTRIYIGVDGSASSKERRWSRWILLPERTALASSDLPATVRSLQAVRKHVVIFDRSSGEQVTLNSLGRSSSHRHRHAA